MELLRNILSSELFYIVVFAILSEVMPFLPIKSNGILHLFVKAIIKIIRVIINIWVNKIRKKGKS